MQDQELNQLATQMVSQLKSMDNFKAMHKLMLQQFINNSLEAEMSEHLGYGKHHKSEQPNKRNGKMRKTVSTELGDIKMTPHKIGTAVLNHSSSRTLLNMPENIKANNPTPKTTKKSSSYSIMD